mmetsp:Transcript_18206/g.43604  ORF Transcript_18206/g.43604 Transcript_18206/m.43604 type:complete len:248 (-) Transcript_18206:1389-2132(-)
MRPLAAEQRVDLDRLARDRHALLVRGAGERRESLHRFVVVLALAIVLVREVDCVQAIEVARLALQAFDDLAQVACQDGVARHLGLPGRVERPGGTGQVRSAADAAGPWRHDQPGLRILVLEDELEAAEQLRLRPGAGDDTVCDVDAHVEIAFHTADWRDVEGLNLRHGCSFLCRDSNHEDVFFGPLGCGVLGRGSEREVALLVDAGWHVLRHTHDGLRLEDRAGREVEERELGLGAAHARHARARLA